MGAEVVIKILGIGSRGKCNAESAHTFEFLLILVTISRKWE